MGFGRLTVLSVRHDLGLQGELREHRAGRWGATVFAFRRMRL